MTHEEIGKFVSTQSESIGKVIEATTPGEWRAVVVVMNVEGIMIFGSAGIPPDSLRAILKIAAQAAEREDMQTFENRPH